MSGHTAGPWSVANDHKFGISLDEIPVYDANECIVCGVWEIGDDHNGKPYNAIANARLIAAAPELLALAHEVADHFYGQTAPLGMKARALIAKAGGRS